jgi:hypothetical protein
MPQLLRDLVEQRIAAQPDMELGGRVPEPSADDPDVIVSGSGSGLLAVRARPKVLGIDDSGRACLYELREHAVPIGDVSPDQVVDAIRAHAGSGA